MGQTAIPLHISHGRVPWRSWMQLRRRREEAARAGPPRRSMVAAAERVSAPGAFTPEQRREASRRLMAFCEWLSARLRRPVTVRRPDGSVTFVHVFGVITYRISHLERRIEAGAMLDGRFNLTRRPFEVGRPLDAAGFLRVFAARLGLIPGRQGDLFFDGRDGAVLASWLVRSAYQILLAQPAFRRLREATLPRLFGLPADIHWIALACRAVPVGPLLDSSHINVVWRHAERFRRVARENPQLLPVVFAFVAAGGLRNRTGGEDTVALVKNAMLAEKRSNSAWRYLVRHGARIFRPAWEACGKQNRFEVAVRYLGMLEAASLPPPPPPALARALVHAYAPHHGDEARLDQRFPSTLCQWTLRSGLLEAHRRRLSGQIDRFIEEFLGVCWWAGETLELIGGAHNGARWGWLVKQWKRAQAERIAIAQAGSVTWGARLPRICLGEHVVVPLVSSADLVREALAMRNCLGMYREECQSGEVEIYSIRRASDGHRVACAGFDYASGVPELFDLKGYANSPARHDAQKVAESLLTLLLPPRLP